MKKNFTGLHSITQKSNNKEITQLLVNVFREHNNEKLIKYIMKKDQNKNTVLHVALEN
jgi:peptidyl-tRNA hydrolase